MQSLNQVHSGGANKKLRLTIVRSLKREGIVTKSAEWGRDLGIATTVGSKRRANLLQKRFNSTSLRASRIAMLVRFNKKATVLVKTGAMPQATYGHEAIGCSPSMMAQLVRTMGMACVNNAKGKCLHTVLALHLGMPNHPRVKCRIDMIGMWFYLLRMATDLVAVSRAWCALRQKFLTAKHM